MKVHLLYEDREWKSRQNYYDSKNIIDDLGLEYLFRTASREQTIQEGLVQSIVEADSFIETVMKKVMLEPLITREEIQYRQAVVQDCLDNEEFAKELYAFSSETMERWDKLGRQENRKNNNRNATSALVSEVHVFRMFVDRLEILRNLIEKYEGGFQTGGLHKFAKSVKTAFSQEIKENVNKILDDISFYVDKDLDPMARFDWDKKKKKKARLVIQCDISQGLKFSSLKLEDVETIGKRYKKHKRTKTFEQRYFGIFAPPTKVPLKEDIILAESMQLEYEVVHYLMGCCSPFINACKDFFEQLNFQSAFLVGAINLRKCFTRHKLPCCYPVVGSQRDLVFEDLKELSMAISQCTTPIGNDASIQEKNLLIVTGANQGGKSTFLRSIGIAQLMMQSGLFVAAKHYESGIYPAFFTHFTRREDSEMNSGRLDEELGRMSGIIENLGEASLVLLNESFATTTEKEGSVIAYDIIKALTEAGVKVLTVTHLLSFAKKVYEEGQGEVEFLSAQRLEDGSRTFKMIQQEPQLTSFGLDLYEDIIMKN